MSMFRMVKVKICGITRPQDADQVVAVNVVSHLFSFVAKDGVEGPANGAFGLVGQELIKLCS